MSTITITGGNLADLRPGDIVIALDGHTLREPRKVGAMLGPVAPGVDGVRLDVPGSSVEHVLYPGRHETLTIERARVRRFSTPKAAAKAWGTAHGIVNTGGSLYWDAENRIEAAELVAAAGHGLRFRVMWSNARVSRLIGQRVERGYLVTGYSANTGTDRGWETLSGRLLARGTIVERDGKYEVQA